MTCILLLYVSLSSFQCAYPQESYSEVLGDGSHGGMEYFACANGYGAFVPISGVQKDNRFGDTSLPASSSTTPSFPLMQHLADGPPKLLTSTELQPIQETLDYGSDASDDEEDHEIQPLLEVGDEHVYYLRFVGDLGGLIVGRGGSNVRMVEEESHAKVHVMEKRPVTEDVRVLVVGTKERCMKAIKLLAEQLKHKTANLQKYCETMDLTDAEAGKVVGVNGTTKQMIEVYSGAVLQVERRPEGMAGLFGVGNRKCKIYGSRGQVEKAKSLISDIQEGKDVSYLQLLFAFSQMLRSMPQGVSVQNHLVDESEQDEVHSILGPLLKL